MRWTAKWRCRPANLSEVLSERSVLLIHSVGALEGLPYLRVVGLVQAHADPFARPMPNCITSRSVARQNCEGFLVWQGCSVAIENSRPRFDRHSTSR